jgi:hypothetical protein
MSELDDFAKRYAKAWCSQNPGSVAAFYAENGSLSVNHGTPAVGRAAIAEIARRFIAVFSSSITARTRGSQGMLLETRCSSVRLSIIHTDAGCEERSIPGAE